MSNGIKNKDVGPEEYFTRGSTGNQSFGEQLENKKGKASIHLVMYVNEYANTPYSMP